MSDPALATVQSFSITHNGIPGAANNALKQDGVVCLREAINSSWLEIVEDGIELALNGASTDVDIVKRKDDSGSFSVSSGAWMQVEPFRQFIFDSPVADYAWALLDTQQLVLFYDFLLIKEACSNSANTPWHQDHSYYPLDGIKAINCWVALDDIPEESALQFMQASHKTGTLYRAVDFDDPASSYRHARNELPLPPGKQIDFPSTVLTTAVRAGDLLVWYSYTLHSAPGNRLNRRRAAFSTNWLGDDIVFNGEPCLDTYRDSSQVVGQAITCEKFPLVRGQSNTSQN